MDIEELVQKYYSAWARQDMTMVQALEAALTELSETHAVKLRAYEATVANLEERIRQLEAERPSPELLAFLRGAAPLEGVWFGHKHPTKHAPYWWRSYLGAHVLPSAPAKEGE